MSEEEQIEEILEEANAYNLREEVKLTAEKKSIHIFNYENKLRIY